MDTSNRSLTIFFSFCMFFGCKYYLPGRKLHPNFKEFWTIEAIQKEKTVKETMTKSRSPDRLRKSKEESAMATLEESMQRRFNSTQIW